MIGVYIIENTKTGQFYIGSSKHIMTRLRDHKRMLREGRHPNERLQAAWNQDGRKAFVFRVLQTCPRCDQYRLEQEYIDSTQAAEVGYNISPYVTSPGGRAPGEIVDRPLGKPRPVQMGDIVARVVRGPRKDGSGQWYWRACREGGGKPESVWCGWGIRNEVLRTLAGRVAAGVIDVKRVRGHADRVDELLDLWVRKGSPGSMAALQPLHDALGLVLLDRLDARSVTDYRGCRRRMGATPNETRIELLELLAAWTWARSVGITPIMDDGPDRLRGEIEYRDWTDGCPAS